MQPEIQSAIIEENEMDFIKLLTVISTSVIVVISLWFIFSDSLITYGPESMVLEQEKKFENLVILCVLKSKYLPL